MTGFRHQVGGDWYNYFEYAMSARTIEFSSYISSTDPAYALLNWVGGRGFGGIYFVNVISSILFMTALGKYCSRQPNPWIALVIAYPFLVMVVSMGFTRQAIAIGFCMLAINGIKDNHQAKVVFYIVIAALFHKTAIFFLAPIIFLMGKQGVKKLIYLTALTAVLFSILLYEHIDNLLIGYVEAQYNASGALVRVMMNALPALIYMSLQNKFDMGLQERRFWKIVSYMSLIFIPVLLIFPSTSVIDRLALYFSPIQLMLYSGFSTALRLPASSELIARFGLVMYSLFIFLIWMFYGDNSHAWLPYKNIVFEN